eukprot:GILJ01004361.1.p1 GENE.GILJ01004361.1~~GILJ01004361.1.p1  ORF type:complete len:675 (+),score=140.25 GILJ01004361.1:109-2025(+)
MASKDSRRSEADTAAETSDLSGFKVIRNKFHEVCVTSDVTTDKVKQTCRKNEDRCNACIDLLDEYVEKGDQKHINSDNCKDGSKQQKQLCQALVIPLSVILSDEQEPEHKNAAALLKSFVPATTTASETTEKVTDKETQTAIDKDAPKLKDIAKDICQKLAMCTPYGESVAVSEPFWGSKKGLDPLREGIVTQLNSEPSLHYLRQLDQQAESKESRNLIQEFFCHGCQNAIDLYKDKVTEKKRFSKCQSMFRWFSEKRLLSAYVCLSMSNYLLDSSVSDTTQFIQELVDHGDSNEAICEQLGVCGQGASMFDHEFAVKQDIEEFESVLNQLTQKNKKTAFNQALESIKDIDFEKYAKAGLKKQEACVQKLQESANRYPNRCFLDCSSDISKLTSLAKQIKSELLLIHKAEVRKPYLEKYATMVSSVVDLLPEQHQAKGMGVKAVMKRIWDQLQMSDLSFEEQKKKFSALQDQKPWTSEQRAEYEDAFKCDLAADSGASLFLQETSQESLQFSSLLNSEVQSKTSAAELIQMLNRAWDNNAEGTVLKVKHVCPDYILNNKHLVLKHFDKELTEELLESFLETEVTVAPVAVMLLVILLVVFYFVTWMCMTTRSWSLSCFLFLFEISWALIKSFVGLFFH